MIEQLETTITKLQSVNVLEVCQNAGTDWVTLGAVLTGPVVGALIAFGLLVWKERADRRRRCFNDLVASFNDGLAGRTSGVLELAIAVFQHDAKMVAECVDMKVSLDTHINRRLKMQQYSGQIKFLNDALAARVKGGVSTTVVQEERAKIAKREHDLFVADMEAQEHLNAANNQYIPVKYAMAKALKYKALAKSLKEEADRLKNQKGLRRQST